MGVAKVAVIGCGMMGRGIVEVTAQAGIEVVAVKATGGDLEAPKKEIAKSLDRQVKKGKLTPEQHAEILARITITADIGAVASADIVVESAVEEEAAKVALLKQVEAKMNPEAVLGTNTSSLRLETLAAQLKRPERFLGLHFFSPVPMMKLVEMGGIPQTGELAYLRAEEYCKQISKVAVRIKSSPGYVVNRLLVPYLLHGIETLESGIATAEGIDTSMQLGCGHPMGPLALSDLIGLDIVYAMAETMHRELKDPRYKMPKTLVQLFEAKQLGRKSGVGIYDYRGEKPVLNPAIQINK
jgi:3-hydroxybutyryl-CoA dehydrogenase